MRTIKLTLAYDGTHFNGWQIQSNNQRTVQGEIKKALKEFLNEDVTLIASGRTDTGVHAQGQVAHFKSKSKQDITEIQKSLNALLPEDISAINIEEVSKNFHAQYDAKLKTYRYQIFNSPHRNPYYRSFYLHYPHTLSVRRMREAAKDLIGKKDFKSFQSKDSSKPHRQEDTIRTITQCAINKKGDCIDITITADGFLYKMVRNIVGTLIDVGSKKLETDSIQTILSLRNRQFASSTAKANGLSLMDVQY